jgi:hypothetical protein
MPSTSGHYQSIYGSGYLLLEDGSSPQVGYKIIIDGDDWGGGGFLLGLSEEDSYKAAQLKIGRLRISVDKYLAIVIGRYDGDWLPLVVLGAVKPPETSAH